ncbi:hypothetical protein XENOCAPTIV_016377 [Xenoophorus captivus]|uniref:Uncharacterized protein n=1 Tax=Xenoophorus captivus TaxID=1517983 RepID=A0ABV0RSE6_9TELE
MCKRGRKSGENRKCLMQRLLAWQGTKHKHRLMKNEEKTEATNTVPKVPPPPPYINPNNPSSDSSTTNSLYPLLNIEEGQFQRSIEDSRRPRIESTASEVNPTSLPFRSPRESQEEHERITEIRHSIVTINQHENTVYCTY